MPVEHKSQRLAKLDKSNHSPDYELIYLTLWEGEQEHTRTRWTVTTFFMSISFAIFGLSLQLRNPPIPLFVTHLASLAIYWFAYVLFLRFNKFTEFMRAYLKNLERSGKVAIDFQTQADEVMRGSLHYRFSTSMLLLVFGLVYTAAVLLLWLLS